MAMQGGKEVENIGCGGMLMVPLSTVAVGAELLFVPGRARKPTPGPYRAMGRTDDHPRPLTQGSMRLLGAMFLCWTLLLPGLLAARAIQIYWTMPIGLVASVGLVWLAMFVGHLIACKLFQVIEPRLPHEGA
jgi:hypothetical protein